MPIVRGMFGAPVFIAADGPTSDPVNDYAKLTALNQRQQELDMEGARQQSLADNRQTLAGIEQQNAINGRLQALVQLAPDNPDLATQFLNEDTELQQAFNIKPGQMKFEGRRGRATVVKDLYGGRTLLIDPFEKDPAKRIVAEVGTTPPPQTESQARARAFSSLSPDEQRAAVSGQGKKSGRAPTKAELTRAALNGDEEAAQTLAEMNGLTGLVSSLSRRAAGGGVTDPFVKGMKPEEAKAHLAELGKYDATKALVNNAILGGSAPGGGAAGGEKTITVRNPETGEEFEGPASAGVPDGYELVED